MPACMHGMIRATYPAPIMQYSCFAVTGRGAVLISSCLPDESSSPPLALLVCALHPCVPASQDPRLATSSALDNAATRTANSCKTDAVRKHTTKSDSLLLIFQKKNLYPIGDISSFSFYILARGIFKPILFPLFSCTLLPWQHALSTPPHQPLHRESRMIPDKTRTQYADTKT